MTQGLRGSISEFPLRTLLRLFADTKKTGELQVREGDRVGALGLAEGRVVCAVFAEEPALSALSEIFTLDGAEFEFTAWEEAPPANLEGELDDLLRKAEDHRKWLASVREVIPNDRVRFRLSERAADQGAVTFTSDRWRVVLAVNGERDVAALAETLHIDRDTALTTLAGLVRDGVIDAVAPTEPPPPSPQPPPERPRLEEPATPSSASQWSAPAATRAPPPQVREPEPVVEQAPPAPEPETRPAPEPMHEWAPAQSIAPPPATEPPPPVDDRLAALSGIFGPAPTEPAPPPAAEHWGSAPAPAAPGADQLSAGPPTAAPGGDQWSAPSGSAPAPDQWSAPAPAAPANDQWSAPPDQWSAPAPAADAWSTPAPAPAADQWTTPTADDPRLAAFAAAAAAPAMPVPEAPAAPRVDEWAAPPAEAVPAAPEKKRGLFGFGKKEKAQAAAPGGVTIGPVSRPAMLAALSNALIGEYNSGQYGKNRVESVLSRLLMRVDEQADPIDRPLPIVDERIDVQALDRDRTPSDQLAPYLALLVSTIYSDAEKAFGKDKAKKGYRAAMVSALGSDSVALATPELAGKLPKV